MFCSTCALALLTAGAPAPGKSVIVPFELLRSGHMAVKVKVNGKGPFRLIFDTGAPINLFNNKVARAAGLLKNGEAQALPLFGPIAEVKVKRLEVGDQAVEDVPGIVMDHPTVDAISRALGPIDGIVGFPFFARFKTTLDYKARTLTFAPSDYQPPDVMKALMLSLMATVGEGDKIKVLSPAAQWGFRAVKGRDDEDAGVSVKEVFAGGPAAKAGLKAGDRLLTMDGRWTDTLADLFAAAEKVKPGTEIMIRVKRDGGERELRIKPGAGL